ncbi:GPI-GlcNAc transferase complex, PIG-H component [Nesidiocoris tenuis]|uniref:GPI-GlcNAc transferase complex, PIG-H component n=1 Tax=Nesidiocoris tenuis TaxID=355587 RepID=A0ABN7ALP5_9HEMI|nr:GPI-GlcNAc transferase complex, PIG-H component [Nesidiocoris tenuis]
MELHHRLATKCFSRAGNVEQPSTHEFTVSIKGDKPIFGILAVVALGIAVFVKSECLQERTCAATDVCWLLFLAVLVILYFHNYLSTVQKETLLLVMPLGLEMSTITRGGRRSITWIPWSLIGDFMILDVISGQKVIFCLAVTVKECVGGQEKTLILFRNTRPRLNHLETIYKELQTSLDKYR